MAISYEGIGQVCVTMRADQNVTAGMPINIFKSDCVSPADVEDSFVGVAAQVHDAYASVIVRGFVTVGYSGSSPNVGICQLLADGYGKVTCNAEGNAYLVTKVNTIDKTVTFLL